MLAPPTTNTPRKLRRPLPQELEEGPLGTLRKYIEGEHPRGRGGLWIEKFLGGGAPKTKHRRIKRNVGPRLQPSAPSAKAKERPIRRLRGKRGGVRGQEYDVYATPTGSLAQPAPGQKPERMTREQFAREVISPEELEREGSNRLRRMQRDARSRAKKAAQTGDREVAAKERQEVDRIAGLRQDRAERLRHGAEEVYERRTKQLERRIRRNVGRHAGEQVTPAAGTVRGENDLTAAEVHFNDAGYVSQRTLLAYAEEEAGLPTTAEMYRNPDGSYDPSRAELHADIIDYLLHVLGDDKKPSMEGGYFQSQADPTVIFTGGGYSSGKGGLIDRLRSDGIIDDSFIVIDPDKIKALLPEFQATAMTDPDANLRVYSEAWDVAQQLAAVAREKRLNVVIDGITNSSSEEVAGRVRSFTDAGYVDPRIYYVSMPTETAMKAAAARAAKAKREGKVESMRMIPEVIMRSVHRDVSATIPNVLAQAGELGATVEVYDADQGKDESTGQWRLPKLIASADPNTGQITHQDRAAYRALLHKANEQVLPAESRGPTKGAWKSAGFDTTVDDDLVKRVGTQLDEVWPQGLATDKQAGPISEPIALLSRSRLYGLPLMRTLLDLGDGVAESLDAITDDANETAWKRVAEHPGESVEESLTDNMDRTHVVIGPVKGLSRTLQKIAGEGRVNDASYLQDGLRATISVPTADDLPEAVQALREQVEAQGWTLERGKNFFADGEGDLRLGVRDPGRPGSGYGMLAFYVRTPEDKTEGHRLPVEIQITTNAMEWAKEFGMGHDFYVQQRKLDDLISEQQRDATPEEEDVRDALKVAVRPLYDRAWGVSLHGGADARIEQILMGDDATSAQISQRLNELRRQVQDILEGQRSVERASRESTRRLIRQPVAA